MSEAKLAIKINELERKLNALQQRTNETFAHFSPIWAGYTNDLGHTVPQDQYLRDGMLAYADGTNWNPGGGEGFYRYDTATASWKAVIGTDLLTLVNLSLTGYADFLGIANPAAPAAGTARFHAATTQGFTRFEQDNEGATNIILGRDSVFVARNTSGSDIVKGAPVYVTGSTGNVPNIGLAKADAAATLPAVGVTLDAIANNAFGQVMKTGVLAGYDTSAFAAGATVWVSAATAGTYTNTRPTIPNFIQRMGTVLVSGVGNGSILVVTAPFLGGMETGTNAATFTVSQLIDSGLTASQPVKTDSNKQLTSGLIALADMANLAANSIMGNNTGSPATPLALTTAQVKTLLAIATGDVSGLGTMATQTATNYLAYADARYEIGTFTYDLTTASGTQNMPAISFTPKLIEFMAGVNATGVPLSVGWDDGTNKYCWDQESGSSSSNNFAWNTTASIRIVTAAGAYQYGYISTLGANSVITWTKVGSPTGTATIFYKAYR